MAMERADHYNYSSAFDSHSQPRGGSEELVTIAEISKDQRREKRLSIDNEEENPLNQLLNEPTGTEELPLEKLVQILERYQEEWTIIKSLIYCACLFYTYH